MNSTTIRRAKLARKFGIGLVIAGLVAIAWLITVTVKPIGPALPSIDTWAPLHRLPWLPNPVVLVSAFASLAVIWLGALLVSRQNVIFEAHRRETEDRLRRVAEYGAHYGNEGRIEPYIGSPIDIDVDKEPS